MAGIGYPDFRRQSEFEDTALLAHDAGGAHGANTSTEYGPFYVGNFEYLGIVTDLTAGSVRMSLAWFDDSAMLQSTGQRYIFIDSTVSFPLQARIPNLGRYVKIDLDPLGVVAWTLGDTIFWASRRFSPVEFIPVQQPVQAHTAAALGAGLTSTKGFDQFASGPAMAYLAVGGASAVQFIIQAQNAVNAWINVFIEALAAGTNTFRLITLPSTALRTQIVNTGGAANTYVFNISTPGGGG